MASTTFVDGITPIVAAWLNDVNTSTYNPSIVSTAITYNAGVTGSTSNTVYNKLRESITPQDFMTSAQRADVLAGTLTIGVSAAIASALAASGSVFIPRGSYLIDATIIVNSNKTIYSNGATFYLANGVNNHILRIQNGADNVEISGLRLDGNKANNTGGQGITTGGTGATNIRVHHNYVTNVAGNGIIFAGTTLSGIECNNNYVTGSGIAGISASDSLTLFAFNDNHTWLNNTHGIGIISTATHGTICDNVSWNNGQGTPNADNITGYAIGNFNITVSGNTTFGGLNNGIHMGGSKIILSNNTDYNATQYGLVLRPDTGTCTDCAVTGNVSYNSGQSGFWISGCTNTTVTGNVSGGSVNQGFLIDNCTYTTFTGNAARSNGIDGFNTRTSNSFLTFLGNTATANVGDGLEIGNTTDSVFMGNTLATNGGWGINFTGTSGRNLVSTNVVSGNTTGQIATPDITTSVLANQTGVSSSVASATTVTLPVSGEFFTITGTTTITSITASYAGRQALLQFAGALTLTDGSNLKLASNFVTTADDIITLVSDGTNWIECSRSVN